MEDEDAAARTIARSIKPYGTPRRASSARAARKLLGASSRWTGVVLDIGLPDSSGLELLESERASIGDTPVLVLSGSNEKHDVNRAFRSGAEYLCKPVEHAEVARFARRALVRWWTRDPRVASLVDDLCERVGLGPSDCAMIAMAAGGVGRQELALALDLTPDTLKSRIRRVLRKCDKSTLDELVRWLLEDAKAGSESGPPARRQPRA